MLGHKYALLSRCIVPDSSLCPSSHRPISGVLLVSQGVIEALLPLEQCDLDRIRSEYVLEDLGELCIFPGVVDLNVELNGEPTQCITQAAVMGGVTTLATHQPVHTPAYTDIAPLGLLSDDVLGSVRDLKETGIFGLRTFLVSQDASHGRLTNLVDGLMEAAEQELPVFLHPEYMSEKSLALTSPYRELDTAQRQLDAQKPLKNVPEFAPFDDSSDNDEDEEDLPTYDRLLCAPKSLYHTPISRNEGVIRRTSLKAPSFVKPFDACEEEQDPGSRQVGRKQRVSLPSIFTGLSLQSKSKRFVGLFKSELNRFRKMGVREVMKRGSWMSSSSESIEEEGEKQGQEDPGMLAEATFEYTKHLQAHPPQLEVDAVLQAIQAMAIVPNAKVHISAVGSARAVHSLQTTSTDIKSRITVSTASAFLHYSESDVKPGDTRYKCNPPIRDQVNQSELMKQLQEGCIDCVTAYHQPHNTGAKFFGSFTRAKNGITSIGLALQVLWSKVKEGLKDEEIGDALGKLSEWVSEKPAAVLGLDAVKGSLRPGKHADFIVWDPHTSFTVTDLPYQYPEMCPYKGERLTGQIYRTYLRGSLVYSNSDICTANGIILSRNRLD